MALPPRPKSIPKSLYNEKIIKIANEDVVKMNNALMLAKGHFDFMFTLFRVSEGLAIAIITSMLFLFQSGINYYLIAGTIVSLILSRIFLSMSEEYIEVMVILSTRKDTMIWEKAFQEFADNN